MMFQRLNNIVTLFFILISVTYGQEDSLRSALKAVDRRQRDLSQFSRFSSRLGNSYERPDDLAFLGNSEYQDRAYESSNDPSSFDYLDYEPYSGVRASKKSISSSFRERVEQDKERQLEEIARIYLEYLNTPKDSYENDEYDEIIRELIEKYKSQPTYPRNSIYSESDVRKRQYYPSFGLDSVGLRKRSRYFEPDGPTDYYHLLSYAPRDEVFDRLEKNNDADNVDYSNANKFPRMERKYIYGSNSMKRFPVSKRSSPYTSDKNQDQNGKKDPEGTNKSADPIKSTKFEQPVLSKKINKSSTNTTASSTTEKPKESKPNSSTPESKLDKTPSVKPKEETKKTVKKARAETKEIPFEVESSKPLKIKKKSINWSDYFGLDRRKKSDDNLDGDWLRERYHKAVSSESKKDTKYQLKSFKNHDEPERKSEKSDLDKERDKKTVSPTDDTKIDDMDAKLRSMEDSIIDDAIKYTGAHEGITDSKEIQEVKDKVISRLAAAYSLEKMRRALSEYKLSIAKEKERMLQEQKGEDFSSTKKKRLSVPRKEAVDDEHDDANKADNDIKCSQGDEDCIEQNYKTPSDILEQHSYETGNCPKIERACSEISTILGYYARVFQTACNMHQMCLLCSKVKPDMCYGIPYCICPYSRNGNNSWFAPTRQCNVLFLSKSYELCSGNSECQREAQRSVRYMLNVNRSLRSEPLEDCDLTCPDKR